MREDNETDREDLLDAAFIFAQACSGEVMEIDPPDYLYEPDHYAHDCFHYVDPVSDWE